MRILNHETFEYDESTKYYYVYEIKRRKLKGTGLHKKLRKLKTSGKTHYIGFRGCFGSPYNDTDYLGSSKLLKQHIDLIGKDMFDKDILYVYTYQSEAFEHETFLIKEAMKYKETKQKLFNISDNDYLVKQGTYDMNSPPWNPPNQHILRKKKT